MVLYCNTSEFNDPIQHDTLLMPTLAKKCHIIIIIIIRKKLIKKNSKNDELAGTNSCQIKLFWCTKWKCLNSNQIHYSQCSVKFLWKIKLSHFFWAEASQSMLSICIYFWQQVYLSADFLSNISIYQNYVLHVLYLQSMCIHFAEHKVYKTKFNFSSKNETLKKKPCMFYMSVLWVYYTTRNTNLLHAKQCTF